MYSHKQNNSILICIVRFLVRPQDPASLCKPWDFLWTWMLGQHTGCFTTSFYIYQAQSSQPSVGFIRLSTNRLHLYQQYTYINNALISTTNHQPSQHRWVYQAINNNTCTYINNKWPLPISHKRPLPSLSWQSLRNVSFPVLFRETTPFS